MPKHTIHTPGEKPQEAAQEAQLAPNEVTGEEPSIRDTLADMQAKIDAQAAQIAGHARELAAVGIAQTSSAKTQTKTLPTEAEGMALAAKLGHSVLSESGWCVAPPVPQKA